MLLAASAVFGQSLYGANTSRRQYIEVQTCSVQKGKIVVTTRDQVYELKRLRTDLKGAYVCPSDVISVQKIENSGTVGPD